MRARITVAGWSLAALLVACALAGVATYESALAVVLPVGPIAAACAVLAFALICLLLFLQSGRHHLLSLLATAAVLATTLVAAWVRLPACREFQVQNGAVSLAGSACTPWGPGPFPAAVLVQGSGREPRGEMLFYARYLARRGIAAVAYDKRGSGASSGDTYGGTYLDYASDAAAVAAWAAAQPFTTHGEMGFVGFSEAEWVIPEAARSVDPAFIVLVGASGLTPAGQVSEEIALRLRERGFSPTDISRAEAVSRALSSYIRGDLDTATLDRIVSTNKDAAWYKAAQKLPDAVYPRADYAWWGRVMDFSTQGYWKSLHVPVLLLKGGKDDRSHPENSLTRIRAYIDPGVQVDARILPAGDHALLEWPLGERVPPPVFTDGYPALIARWILSISHPPPLGPATSPTNAFML